LQEKGRIEGVRNKSIGKRTPLAEIETALSCGTDYLPLTNPNAGGTNRY
jgi:hypothetical protein